MTSRIAAALIAVVISACSGGIGRGDDTAEPDAGQPCASGVYSDAGVCVTATTGQPPGPGEVLDAGPGPTCIGLECDAAGG